MSWLFAYTAIMSTRRTNGRRGSARKEELLQVRVDGAEKEAFADAAALSGIALSAWVRERLRQTAARELEAAERPVAFLKIRKER